MVDVFFFRVNRLVWFDSKAIGMSLASQQPFVDPSQGGQKSIKKGSTCINSFWTSPVCVTSPELALEKSFLLYNPTCQVRVVGFYQSSSTTSTRSQWALADLNSKCQNAVGTTGPQQQVPDRSGHYMALPDFNSNVFLSTEVAKHDGVTSKAAVKNLQRLKVLQIKAV